MMKKLYTTIITTLMIITTQSQTFEFSISYLGINATTGNYQVALIANPSSTVINGNTTDMLAAFYVPTGVTLGNFVEGNSGLPTSDWSSNSLGSNANGDGYYLARVEAGAMSTILNGDDPFQLIIFDIIASPNPTSGSITFIENGDEILTSNFIENYININFNNTGYNNAYSQNNPSESSISFALLGIQKNLKKKNYVKIYPNPAFEYFSIESGIKIDKIELYDILGQRVIETSETNQINIKNLNSGLYTLKAYNVKKFITKKLIIK